MVTGLSHITLLVKNLEKASHLLKTVLEAQEVYSSDGNNFSLSSEKFFMIGGMWMVLMQGEHAERSYQHIAFEVNEEDLPLYQRRLEELKVEILPGRPRHHQEGQSLYFYDYDNHLFELHAGSLSERLAFYSHPKERGIS